VDIKPPDFEPTRAHDFQLLDLRRFDSCLQACISIDHVYGLAANMGGIGFIETNRGLIVRDNTLINLHSIEAARIAGVSRYLYTSSACIYPGYRQRETSILPLREEEAYPADPEDGYGWEKLYMERVCRHYSEDFGLDTRVVRFHNIYGPLGTYDGGREKSPAAICRKIALAKSGDTVEVWGDGLQTRSYCYIDDCVEGLLRIMRTDLHQPVNLGQDRMISINQLVALVSRIAGKSIATRHDMSKPQGVRGRNSDNSLLEKLLQWSPQITLETGLERTYRWIRSQVELRGGNAESKVFAATGAGR